MLQRAEAGKHDHSWEFPGGHIDGDESPFEAAKREWEEEVGLKLPDGHISDKWKDGVYRGFVYVIGHEADLDLHNRKNPEHAEVIAWWDVKDAKKNPALRAELDDSADEWVDAVKFYPSYTKSDLYKESDPLVNEIQALQSLFAQQANSGQLNQEASDKICENFAKAIALLQGVHKGDAPGHEFHGNRFTGGVGRDDKEFWARIQAKSPPAPSEERTKFSERVKDVAARVKNLAMRSMSSPDSNFKAVVVVSALRAVAVGLALAAGHQIIDPGTHIPITHDLGHLPTDAPPMVTNPATDPTVQFGDTSSEPPPLPGDTGGGPPFWATDPNWLQDRYPDSSVLRLAQADFFKGDSPGHEFRGNQYTGQIGSNADKGRWMPENDDHAAALERLVKIPSAGTKTIDGEAVKDAIPQQLRPTPYTKDNIEHVIRNTGVVIQSDEKVKVADLHGTNPYVSRRSIASAMKGAVQGPGGSFYRAGYKVQVAQINGRMYVLDGNHRANAAAVLHQDTVDAVVFRPQLSTSQQVRFAERGRTNIDVAGALRGGHGL